MSVTQIRRGPRSGPPREPPTPPVVAGRVPPSDLDTEAAVISACLLDAAALDEVADVVRGEHCYSTANRLVLEAILALHEAAKPVDTTTVADHLRSAGNWDRAGGSAYLAQLVDATPAVTHARDHALRLRELWRVRTVIAACQVAAAEGYGAAEDSAGYLDRTGTALFGALESHGQEHTRPVRDALRGLWERQRRAEEGTLEVVASGLVDVDKRLRCEPGDLVVVAARPGMGKSALAQGWAVAAARAGHSVLVLSLEMPAEQVAGRMQSQLAGVDLQRMLAWRLSATEQASATEAAVALSQLPIHIDDRAACSVVDVRSIARRVGRDAARAGAPLRLVVVDYLQLMRADGQTREQEIASITRGLKVAARELGVAVVALAQLNRELERRQDKRPMLSDLRESGAVEQDADSVVMLYRDDYYDRESEDRGVAEIIVAKQRNGPTGCVRVKWFASCARFESLAPGEHQEAEG